MREFTVTTKKKNDDQGYLGSTPPTHQPKDNAQEEAEMFTQKENFSNSSDDIPSDQISEISKKSDNNILSAVTIFIAFIGVGLIAVNIVLGSRYLGNKRKNTGPNILGVSEQSENKKTIPEHLKDKIIYTDKYNVFIADKTGDNPKQLTHYPKQNNSELSELELIDERTIGYFRCPGLALNPMCEISKLDILSGEIIIEEKINSNQYLVLLTWADTYTYAYTSMIPSDQNYILVYKDSFKREILDEYPLGAKQRESSFIEDSLTLKFSPNKQKLLFIDSRTRGGFDFTAYIYSTSGEVLDTLQEATQPDWIDDSIVVFRSYSNVDAGYLFKRNIETKSTEKVLQSMEASYNPIALNSSIVFWENVKGGLAYILRDDSSTSEPIEAYSAFPVWLSENEVIVARTRNCSFTECREVGTTEFETQFIIDYYYTFNIDTKETYDISSPKEYLQHGIVTWYHPHI